MNKDREVYCGAEEEITAYREKYLIPPSDRLSGFLPKKLSNWLEKGVKLTTKMTPKKFYKELDGYKEVQKRYEKWYREGRFYGDFWGETPEFNTFPVKVRPGFAKEFVDAVMVQRARMVLKNGKARGLRLHYNRSDRSNRKLCGKLPDFEKALGPALDLMVLGNDKFYRDYDDKYDEGRLQLRMSGLRSREQLEVAPVFFEGILRAIQSSSLGQHYHELPLVKNEGRESITGKIRSYGSAAKIRTKTGEEKTALDFFSECFQTFKSYMEEVATPEEMELLEKYAKGEKKFEVESKPDPMIDRDYIIRQTGKTPEKLIADYVVPEGPARLFSDAACNKIKELLGGKLTRRTSHIEWNKIIFEFERNDDMVVDESKKVQVDSMEQYMKDVLFGSDRSHTLIVHFKEMENYMKQESSLTGEKI